MNRPNKKKKTSPAATSAYSGLVGGISELVKIARRSSARAVNALMTATYWEVGRRIVEFEQDGERRAGYGAEVLLSLSVDLTERFGRGFPRQNLQDMRQLYRAASSDRICQTPSGKTATGAIRATVLLESEESANGQTLSAQSGARIPHRIAGRKSAGHRVGKDMQTTGGAEIILQSEPQAQPMERRCLNSHVKFCRAAS